MDNHLYGILPASPQVITPFNPAPPLVGFLLGTEDGIFIGTDDGIKILIE